jgi:hypothetical protein
MAVPGRKIENNSINFAKRSLDQQTNRHIFIRGDHQPSLSTTNGYGDPTGVAGNINRAMWRGMGYSQFAVLGTQTLLGPLLDTTGKGVDLSQDQTDNDGVEHVWGALTTNGPTTFTVGTDNCYLRMKFRIADVSGTDDCCVGWRKNEAFQANVDDYDEAAFINVILGDIKVETILNNGATITTDTTQDWADDATKTLEVQVRGTAVNYLIDGVVTSVPPAFNFDTGEVIVPFFYFLQATTLPGKLWLLELECGHLSEKATNLIM